MRKYLVGRVIDIGIKELLWRRKFAIIFTSWEMMRWIEFRLGIVQTLPINGKNNRKVSEGIR